jgi:hypothetical protein
MRLLLALLKIVERVEMSSTNEFVQNLRNSISIWKQQQLIESIQEDQDNGKLNDYLKITAMAHDLLKKYVESEGKSQIDSTLNTIIQAIGNLSGLTTEQRMMLEEYIFRDLVEYPFTFNVGLINSFEQRNVLDTNIVPNK